jgi:hypothetical protein
MSQNATLESVQSALRRGACTLDELWLDHAPIWQQLGWSQSQVSLWLGCLPSVHACTMASGEKGYQLDVATNPKGISLADEMVAVLENAGRPLPLVHLRGKLPPGLVVTEPMLRAAAMNDARLEVKGPLVKLT